MSELRDEIERNFRAYGLLDDETKEGSATAEETAASAPEEVLPPQDYAQPFAEDFKNLSPAWQNYLLQREAYRNEQDKYLSGLLSEYDVLRQLFQAESLRLRADGINKMIDWFAGLAEIDRQLHNSPVETIMALAKVYGVELGSLSTADPQLTAEVSKRLRRLEDNYHDLTNHLEELQIQKLADVIRIFGQEKDARGNIIHPYFDEVKDQIFDLLNVGLAEDVLEAYNKALWLNPHIREELIKQKINSQAADAKKAQKAAFGPKGKAEAPERELTLREEIAKNMAALMD